MELNDAIYRRRSVRRFTDQEVEPATINSLLGAAVQAPSALNQQPWGFAVLHGRELLQDYSTRAKTHLIATFPASFEVQTRTELYGNPDYDLFHGANTAVVIYSTQGKLHPSEDCCLAAENLMLAAYGFGLGSCPVGFARPWFDLAEIKDELGIPSSFSAVFPLVVGYPRGDTPPVSRNEPEILCWKWAAAPA